MAIYPQRYFTKPNVGIATGRFGQREPYASDPIGRKFIGAPKGVYHGFIPSKAGAVLSLAPDPTEMCSLIKVPSNVDPAGIDIRAAGIIQLDFSTTDDDLFLPDGIQVLARASYRTDQPTVAQIVTRQKTTSTVVATIGGSPTTYDLSVISLEAPKPGDVHINVDVDGVGVFAITDDSHGVFPPSAALPAGGTISYDTGELTGVTAPLSAGSNVVLIYSRFSSKNEVLICEVTGSHSAINFVAVPGVNRDVPIALDLSPYGLMPTSSIEQLEEIVDVLNEVAAARVDLEGTTHTLLGERIAADLSGSSMGGRLALVHRLLRSNTHSVTAGNGQIIVSGSFAETTRAYAPFISIAGGGSETSEGAVTGPLDAVRNVCIVLDASTGYRLIDDAANRLVVFGRLAVEDDVTLQGTLSFTNASINVYGLGATHFDTEIAAGDTILGPDGKFYEVATTPSATHLTLSVAYQGVTAQSGGLIRRRFTLTLRRIVDGVEKSFTPESDTTINFFFPVFTTHAVASFDSTLFMHQAGERPPVPDASTSTPGKMLLTSNYSPYVGSVLLSKQRSIISGGPFHTLNFTGAPGTLMETSPGTVLVTRIGQDGPKGYGGGPGPPGDRGETGRSIDSVEWFAVSGEYSAAGTWTHDFGFEIAMASVGFAWLRDIGYFSPDEGAEITDFSIIAGSEGKLSKVTVSWIFLGGYADHRVGFYADACGTSEDPP